MLKIEHLSKTFKKTVVLDDICLELENGIYGLVGPNGAGKTTLFRCLTGLYQNSGKNFIPGKRIGYLPQKFGVFRDATVENVMKYFAVGKDIERKEVAEEIEKSLLAVNLESMRKKKVKTLSGGMVRRLGIAVALLGNPPVLLLDEPTVGLDPEERVRMKMILNKIKEDKLILISTHVLSDIESICSRIIIMNRGRIVANDYKEKIAEYARGKVYISKNYMPAEGKNTVIIGYTKRDEDVLYRVISSEKTGDLTEPTIEDGYLCLINEI